MVNYEYGPGRRGKNIDRQTINHKIQIENMKKNGVVRRYFCPCGAEMEPEYFVAFFEDMRTVFCSQDCEDFHNAKKTEHGILE
jgi:hypothetical protein